MHRSTERQDSIERADKIEASLDVLDAYSQQESATISDTIVISEGKDRDEALGIPVQRRNPYEYWMEVVGFTVFSFN